MPILDSVSINLQRKGPAGFRGNKTGSVEPGSNKSWPVLRLFVSLAKVFKTWILNEGTGCSFRMYIIPPTKKSRLGCD